MTVAASPTTTTLTLTGSTLGPFATGWTCLSLAHVRARLSIGGAAAMELTNGSAFAATGASPATSGAQVTLAAYLLPTGGWPVPTTLTLYRRTPSDQPTPFAALEGFSPPAVEAGLDRAARRLQELDDGLAQVAADAGDAPAPARIAIVRWCCGLTLPADEPASTVLVAPGGNVPIGAALSLYSRADVYRDAVFQGPDTYALAGTSLIFSTPVAIGETGLVVFSGGETATFAEDADVAWLNPLPLNEWPDPQLCLLYGTAIVPAMNDAASGTIPPLSVTSYTTGSRTVTVYCANTSQLANGDLVYFDSPADVALRGSALRVFNLVANVSFQVKTEWVDGAPAASAACVCHPMQRGDTTGAMGGLITWNLQKLADGVSWPKVWVSERPAHTALLKGMRRVLVVTKATSGPEYVFAPMPSARVPTVKGLQRAVGLAAYVVTPGAGVSARAMINNGGTITTGPIAATTASRSWLSHTDSPTGAGNIWQTGAALYGPAGSTFVLGEWTEAPARGLLPDGSFSTPRGQEVVQGDSLAPWLAKSVTFPTSFGPDGATYSFVLDMKQTSWGQLGEGISYLKSLMEGQSDTAGNLLVFRQKDQAPTLYSPSPMRAPVSVGSTVQSVGNPANYVFAGGDFVMTPDCKMTVYTLTSGAKWGFLSFDIRAVVNHIAPDNS